MDNESDEPQPPDTQTDAEDETALASTNNRYRNRRPPRRLDAVRAPPVPAGAGRDRPRLDRLRIYGLTRQSAYSLRTRDPVFAASWDAAWDLARAPLADALYERALDGTTETITRDGEVVATRHRHDSRLSIAVLTRLDKRCDRAEERGSRHLALMRNWDDWLRLVGKGEERTAMALLEAAAPETAQHCQFRQLPLGGNPTNEDREGNNREWATDEDEETEAEDLSARCWAQDEIGEKVWMTDFPPPPGFTAYENRPYDELGDDDSYERECTPEEGALLEAAKPPSAAERAEEEQLRDLCFRH